LAQNIAECELLVCKTEDYCRGIRGGQAMPAL
jgi:hypothetical protein